MPRLQAPSRASPMPVRADPRSFRPPCASFCDEENTRLSLGHTTPVLVPGGSRAGEHPCRRPSQVTLRWGLEPVLSRALASALAGGEGWALRCSPSAESRVSEGAQLVPR